METGIVIIMDDSLTAASKHKLHCSNTDGEILKSVADDCKPQLTALLNQLKVYFKSYYDTSKFNQRQELIRFDGIILYII